MRLAGAGGGSRIRVRNTLGRWAAEIVRRIVWVKSLAALCNVSHRGMSVAECSSANLLWSQ